MRLKTIIASAGLILGGVFYALTALSKQLYKNGNNVAQESTNGGKSWLRIPSFNDAEVRSSLKTASELLISGHPGLYRSTDRGATFTRIAFYGDTSNPHSICAAASAIYLGPPHVVLPAPINTRHMTRIFTGATERKD
jgi:hypothetical protein